MVAKKTFAVVVLQSESKKYGIWKTVFVLNVTKIFIIEICHMKTPFFI